MNKKMIIVVICIGLLFVLGVYLHNIDSARVRNGIEPKFTIKTVSRSGDKVTYWGLGYKVIRKVGVSPNEPYQSNIGVKYGSWFMNDNFFESNNEKNNNIDKVTMGIKEGTLTGATVVINNASNKELTSRSLV